MRFGERLGIEIVSTDVDAAGVPPLILQPLVENAVTHGIAHVLEGGTVRIRAARHAASIAIAVENPCDPERPSGRGAGLGLRNVKLRLRTLYGAGASLETHERDGRFVATVELPLEEGA